MPQTATHTHTLTETDDQAIRAVVRQAAEAQSDPDRLLALHHPDAVIVNFGGRRVLGRDAFGAAMRDALASPLSDVTTEVEIRDIRLAAPTVAIVSAVKIVHDDRKPSDGGPLPASTGSLSYVLTKIGRDWLIALAQTTPVLS